MGSSTGKQTVPKEKHAITIGINDYSKAKGGFKNLTNSAQNAFQMSKFFIKHGYQVQSNIKDYDDVINPNGGSGVIKDLYKVFDEQLNSAKEATTKNRKSFFVYYSGIVIEAEGTQELCGVDSEGNLIQLERICEAFSQYKHVFTLFFIQGMFFRDPKKAIGNQEELLKKEGIEITLFSQLETTVQKKKKSMCLMYSNLDPFDPAFCNPYFIMSRQTHDLINTVNSARDLDLRDLHVLFRERYVNLGLPDTQWKNWKIFKDLKIEEITLQENTRKYTGELVNTFMQGFGICQFHQKGHRYEGEFDFDNFEGYGVYIWQNERQYYEGEWKDGKQNGLGMFVKDGGIRYEGEFKCGKFDGHGTAKYPNGDFYIGMWKDNSKHGEGIICFDDCSKYKGQFKKGQIHGKGKMKQRNGDLYDGDFKNGLKDGFGSYQFKDLNKNYTGGFKNDVIQGYGKMEFGLIMTYEGEFKNNLMEGEGIMKYSNGMKYEGDYQNDKKNGKGTLYFEDHAKVIGYWIQDKLVGGNMFLEDGKESSDSFQEIQKLVSQRLSIYQTLNQINYNHKSKQADQGTLPMKTPSANSDPNCKEQRVNLKNQQQIQINKLQKQQILREIISEVVEKAFLQIEYDEEFKEYTQDPAKVSHRRNQLLKFDTLIDSTESSSKLNHQEQGVNFRQSIKQCFQKYYKEGSASLDSGYIDIVPTLSMKDVDQDELEFKIRISDQEALLGSQYPKKEINLLSNIKEQDYFK